MIYQEIFFQISVVMALAAIVAFVARLLKQPTIFAYIVAGIVAGPSVLGLIHAQEAFESFSEIGIALLLFVIGLELRLKTIRTTGKPVAVVFAVTALGTGGAAYILSALLGFSGTEGLIMALALVFSSTIIVVKALSDKREQSRLYGQIAIAILLVEDLVATLALLLVAASVANSGGNGFFLLIVKGAGLAAGLTLLSRYLMPRMGKIFASSQELLYVFAIAWAFGVASTFRFAGFSLEIGALAAGISIAHLPYVQAIRSHLVPLRDFFLVLFFINLGEGLQLQNLGNSLVPALAFSGLLLVSKPLLIMASLGALGFTKLTSFRTATHLSQMSEFSVILIALAAASGVVDERLVSIAALTILITITASTYLINYSGWLYRRFVGVLSIFERAKTRKEVRSTDTYPFVLLGYRGGGHAYVRAFRRLKKRYIVVDYDPEVIGTLEHQHVSHIYGDATDLELLEEIGIHGAEMVISTITDTAINHMLIRSIGEVNKDVVFICHASKLDDAESLYEAGAAYVLTPHYIGNMHIAEFLERHGADKGAFLKYRKKHLIDLGNTALQSTGHAT